MTEPSSSPSFRSRLGLGALGLVALLVVVLIGAQACSTSKGVDGSLPPPATAPPATGGACDDVTGDVDVSPPAVPADTAVLAGIDLVHAEAIVGKDDLAVKLKTAGPIDASTAPTFLIDHMTAGTLPTFELRIEPNGTTADAPWQVVVVYFRPSEQRQPPLKVPVTVKGNELSFNVPKKELPSMPSLIWVFGATAGNQDNAPSDQCESFATPGAGSALPTTTASSTPRTTAPPIPFGTTQTYKPTGSKVTVYSADAPPKDPATITAASPKDQQAVAVDVQVCAPDTKTASTSLDYFQLKDDQNRLYPVWTVDPTEIRTPFPSRHTLDAGDCVRGWVPFTIPTDAKVAAVYYSPDGTPETTLIWKVA